MAPRVLYIGLGNIGRGMCKNIAEKGPLDQPLMLYNRTTQKAVDFSAKLPAGKTEAVENLADGVSKADVIFTCLSNDKAVESTLNEVLKNDIKGKLFIECSTIHPETTEKIAKAIVDKGADFVAAPVFGAPAMADAGQLIVVAAGPKQAVDRARPYFTGVVAKGEVDMTDEPYSKALTLKLIGNTFIVNMVEQLAEGHVLAEKTGLGCKYLHSWIENMFPGPYAAYSNRMLTGDYYKRDYPLFAVDLARKDAGHAMSLAQGAGVRLKNTEVADGHLADVKAHVGEMGDIAGIYGAVRLEAGLKYENEQ
ncbi:NAD binding domain of 6-phosphogluconate dehydrogenase-domain-containing protein [Diplogelasinospora grovesii]|uniref:NAD binding domain of 6-phosphogluconate dehydrogenase-domain-containing protein n=1 Tax=Diplogelasinospora grovesii TaxID=303347 RepID=A0AAN6NDR2_9PEZI|nr:NAD binding domain of 6-phosphogluconate dehydrogenase-domain-containing protein [Diplogelasinospora grovesii]